MKEELDLCFAWPYSSFSCMWELFGRKIRWSKACAKMCHWFVLTCTYIVSYVRKCLVNRFLSSEMERDANLKQPLIFYSFRQVNQIDTFKWKLKFDSSCMNFSYFVCSHAIEYWQENYQITSNDSTCLVFYKIQHAFASSTQRMSKYPLCRHWRNLTFMVEWFLYCVNMDILSRSQLFFE